MWSKHAVGALFVALLLAYAAPAASATTAGEDTRFRDRAKQVDGSHYLVGRVSPDGAGQWVYYQRKTCATCPWKRYAKVLTDDAGRFQVRIAFPRKAKPVWRYRGHIRATAEHPRAEGREWLACARVTCRNPGV